MKAKSEAIEEFAGDLGMFRQFMDGNLLSEEFTGSISKVGEIGSINPLWEADRASSK